MRKLMMYSDSFVVMPGDTASVVSHTGSVYSSENVAALGELIDPILPVWSSLYA